MNQIDSKSIGVIGRKQNAIILNYDKSIVITSDILKYKENKSPTIVIDDELSKIELFAKEILLSGKDSSRNAEPIVYGDKLVDLLRWMITILMTHKHPPNAAPIPDFFVEANSRSRNMEVDLLNKRIKSR